MEQSISTNYKILIPIRLALIRFFDAMAKELHELLDEIIQSSGKMLFPFEEVGEITMSFELTKSGLHSSDFKGISQIADYTFLKIETQISHKKIPIYNVGEKKEDASNLSEAEIVLLSKQYYADIFLDRIVNLIIAANIARPGILRTKPGQVFIDNKKHIEAPEMFNALYEAIVHTQHIGWPQLYKLEILTVWKWLQMIPSFFDGVGKTPVGRALAAFSFLFTSGNDYEPFSSALWAIIGLEALYGEDNSGIQKQLVQRTEAFLGKRSTHKKVISQMYAFRSRFLHGDMDFPMRHTFFTGTQDVADFFKDSSIHDWLAQVVLVATLQKMIKKNLTELNFEISLVHS